MEDDHSKADKENSNVLIQIRFVAMAVDGTNGFENDRPRYSLDRVWNGLLRNEKERVLNIVSS